MNNTPIIKIGRCDICSHDAVITIVDVPTGLRAGRCCDQSLDDAQRFIKLTMANHSNNAGLRHPRPGEFSPEQNH